jgi:hypothetical protein
MAVAEKKAKARDYPGAIAIYESALDGTAETAEIHYGWRSSTTTSCAVPVMRCTTFSDTSSCSPRASSPRKRKLTRKRPRRSWFAPALSAALRHSRNWSG